LGLANSAPSGQSGAIPAVRQLDVPGLSNVDRREPSEFMFV
jgi:hypothetical protein